MAKKVSKKISQLYPSMGKSLVLDQKSIIILRLYVNNQFLSKIN